MENLYNILGVANNATTDEIKERFRFLAQAFHPDKFATSKQKKSAENQFIKISEAYQILVNPNKREQYDYELIGKTSSYSATSQTHAGSTQKYQREKRKRAGENLRRVNYKQQQRLNRIDNEILFLNRDIRKLKQDMPRMSNLPPFIILFLAFAGIYYFLLTLFGNGIGYLFISGASFFIGHNILKNRNSFYKSNCKPIIDEIERRKQRIYKLVYEKQKLINTEYSSPFSEYSPQ